MYCPACGTQNASGRAFCSACGNSLSLRTRAEAALPARFFWLFHCQSLVVLAALGVAAAALIALGWIAFRQARPVAQPLFSFPISSPGISMPWGAGLDFALSGCADETLGQAGHMDNHIRISGVRDLQAISEVDITYPGARWHDPCTGGRGWQIVVVKSGADQLDLFFESATPQAVTVDYTVILTYADGAREAYSVRGTSGEW